MKIDCKNTNPGALCAPGFVFENALIWDRILSMSLTFILITCGLLARAVYISISDYKKTDPITIGLALLAGMYAVGRSGLDYEAGDVVSPWYLLPICFSAVVAFGYKSRLLPTITESTMLMYGLMACVLVSSHFFAEGIATQLIAFDFFLPALLYTLVTAGVLYASFKFSSKLKMLFVVLYFSISIPFLIFKEVDLTVLQGSAFLFLLGYMIIVLFTNITKKRLSKTMQVVMMCLFVSISIFISLWLGYMTISTNMNQFEALLAGFVYLPLLANIFYLAYFIPVPLRRSETYTERMESIRAHANDFEKQYIDIDSTPKTMMLVGILFCSYLILSVFSNIAQPLLISSVLSLSVMVTKPEVYSKFTPAHIRKKQ